MKNTDPKEKSRLFKNSALELLTKTTPGITFTLYPSVGIGIIISNFYYGTLDPVALASFVVGGIFFWTLFEYLMHRYFFHFVTDIPILKRMLYMMHGAHHDYPNDDDRLIMPPLPWLTIAAILFFGFRFLLGDFAFGFIPGMIFGYLGYIFIHYKIHTKNPPKMLKKVLLHHALHHHKYNDKAFGVSSTFWDHVFGTMPPKEEGKKAARASAPAK